MEEFVKFDQAFWLDEETVRCEEDIEGVEEEAHMVVDKLLKPLVWLLAKGE